MLGPFTYQIKVVNGEMQKDRNFESPVTLNNGKIYVISDNLQIIYVGVTSQSIGTRLRTGQDHFKNPKNGYYGYKWLNEDRNLYLDIFVSEESEIREDNEFIETVEAEVAYLVRNLDGQWPANQTEIHFHPSSEKHRRAALFIVNAIKNRSTIAAKAISSM